MTPFRLAAALAASTALLSPIALTAPAMAQTADAAAQKPPADAPYRNAALPDEARIADLIGRMTLDEKIAQIITMWDNKKEVFDANNEFDIAKARAAFPNGIGQFARPSDAIRPGQPARNAGPRRRRDGKAGQRAAALGGGGHAARHSHHLP